MLINCLYIINFFTCQLFFYKFFPLFSFNHIINYISSIGKTHFLHLCFDIFLVFQHLLQLFHEAVQWERNEEKKSPYEKTFIRPRALIRCLPKVSEEALGAVREEFSELDPLLDTLKRIGRTPIHAIDLQEHEGLIFLAREVGLLAVYEERGEEIVRYKIPDLYRYGLKMTRKGQA